VEAAIIEFAKRYGMQKAIEYFGLDKQSANPKYAISLGNFSFDPVNAMKRSALSRGISTAFSGNLSGMLGPAALMGGALMLGRAFNPLNPKSRNYNPNLRQEINFAANRGYITNNPGTGLMQYGPDSVLAGQNVASMFGTNSYLEQLENKKDYFEDRISKGKDINESKYAETLNEISEAKGFNRDKGKVDYGPHGGSNKSNNNGGGSSGKSGGHSGSGYQGKSGSHHYRRGGIANL